MVTPSTGNFDTQRFEGLLSKLKGTAQKSRYASSREQRPGSYGTNREQRPGSYGADREQRPGSY